MRFAVADPAVTPCDSTSGISLGAGEIVEKARPLRGGFKGGDSFAMGRVFVWGRVRG